MAIFYINVKFANIGITHTVILLNQKRPAIGLNLHVHCRNIGSLDSNKIHWSTYRFFHSRRLIILVRLVMPNAVQLRLINFFNCLLEILNCSAKVVQSGLINVRDNSKRIESVFILKIMGVLHFQEMTSISQIWKTDAMVDTLPRPSLCKIFPTGEKMNEPYWKIILKE